MRFSQPMLMYYVLTLCSVVLGLEMNFSDTCDYTKFEDQSLPNNKYLCGNVCLSWNSTCRCGGQNIYKSQSWDDEGGRYCCSPVSTPCKIYEGLGALCSVGNVLSKSSSIPCNETGFCYNDYLTSAYLGRYTRYN